MKTTSTNEFFILNGKKHRIFNLETNYGSYRVICTEERYRKFNNFAVLIHSVEHDEKSGEDYLEYFTDLTVNICPLTDKTATVDTNNNSWAEDFIKTHKLGKPLGRYVPSGYCRYPLYEFDNTKFYTE